MILLFHEMLRARFADTIARIYGIDPPDQPSLVIECPPRRALGDLAVTVAFELARRLRKAPRTIGQELVHAIDIGTMAGIDRFEAAPNGYVNVYLNRQAFVLAEFRQARTTAVPSTGPKTIVEHTAINPNKAAHVGHLRNVTLGDSLARLLRFRGERVEVQNYIDDTGVQVADVVVGFREIDRRDLDNVRQLAEAPRFDYYCWDLYANVTEWYEHNPSRVQLRAKTLHDIESGDTAAAAMAQFVTERIVHSHLATMARLNVDYDLLTWEGDILRLHFWAHAFELLKDAGVVFLQRTGKFAGCWVMRIEDDEHPARDDDTHEAPTESREKVIVRSDGTVTYVGKDIAYQFWKFGLLGRDFHYRIVATQPNGQPLWATTSRPGASDVEPPAFGHADAVYNVIDSRQSYLQKLLQQSLAAMGHTQQADRSIHFAYEMVALTHATARALEYETTAEDQGRPFVEVSGRRGLGVKADDLLDRLEGAAAAEVTKRHPDLNQGEQRHIARVIATAAARYFLIKYSRTKLIAFDIDEALSFEGETGPYLQYSVVRANNIFHKLRSRTGLDEATILASLPNIPSAPLTSGTEGDELWSLVLEAARLDEIVDQAIRTLELAVLAKYAFGLAQAFNALYHRYPIVSEEREDVRAWRAATIAYFRHQMTRALALMGCEVPPRM